LWDQQIMLLWILLTPVFLTSALLVFAAPLIFRDRGIQTADSDALMGQPSAMPARAERKAA
jgi:hypothetical protein